MVLVAAGLTAAPQEMARVWPWTLTPLTARVLGAWTAGFGLVSLWAAWENDRFRMRPAVATLGFGGLAHLLTAVRFRDQVSWEESGAWIYVAVLATGVVVGAAGWTRLTQAKRTFAPPGPAQPPSPRT
jgi:peptidoglycan/LPS O-acetylase OafA/YrhL